MRLTARRCRASARFPRRSRRRQPAGQSGHAARSRRAQRLRQVDAAPDPRRSRAAGQRHDRPRAGDADRRLSAAGARRSRRASRSAALLARRTGIAAADADARRAPRRSSPTGRDAGERYSAALDRFLALGGGDLETRAGAVLAELGLPVGARSAPWSSSRAARRRGSRWRRSCSRATTCSCSTSRRTTSTSTGSSAWSGSSRRPTRALVVVSHDRAFLDRTVTRIAEIEDGRGRVREFAGGWTEYAAARDAAPQRPVRAVRGGAGAPPGARVAAQRAPQPGAGRRRHGRPARHPRPDDEGAPGGAPARAATSWPRSRSSRGSSSSGSEAGTRSGSTVARLGGAVARRGDFTLGPIDLDLVPGERLAVTGRNGSGKSTLLGDAARRASARAGSAGRRAHDGDRRRSSQERVEHGETPLLDAFVAATGLAAVDARTLLAKFGLGADHVGRAWATLSPGERTRAHLAELQAREVNLLVLDEPTNHLDLEAVEQLEQALARLRRHARRRHPRPHLPGRDRAHAGVALGRCCDDRRRAPKARSATLCGRSWQSPSERHPRPVATSAAPSTASP